MSPKPTDRQAHTLSPVNGSVRPDPEVAVAWPEVDELPLELLGPLDDSEEPDEDELPADEDPEDDEPWEDEEEPDPWDDEGVVLASGSVYCWPEAEPAAAAPAPARASAATVRQQVRNGVRRRIPAYSIKTGPGQRSAV